MDHWLIIKAQYFHFYHCKSKIEKKFLKKQNQMYFNESDFVVFTLGDVVTWLDRKNFRFFLKKKHQINFYTFPPVFSMLVALKQLVNHQQQQNPNESTKKRLEKNKKLKFFAASFYLKLQILNRHESITKPLQLLLINNKKHQTKLVFLFQ